RKLSHSHEADDDRRKARRCILAEYRSAIQQSPKDILSIDWREEEEGAQSALMNEKPRRTLSRIPCTCTPPPALPETSPSGWTILWACRPPDTPTSVVLNFRRDFLSSFLRSTDNYDKAIKFPWSHMHIRERFRKICTHVQLSTGLHMASPFRNDDALIFARSRTDESVQIRKRFLFKRLKDYYLYMITFQNLHN
ncbi:hypothetical protein ALC60_09477, partial [Trachymyrmex zeteki]